MTAQPFDVSSAGLTIDESPIITSNGANQIIINSGATGDVGVLLTSATKAVTLTVDTNQKLKVLGGVNSFVFDVSSATGGITFPDGSVQTTAAAGGGGDEEFNPAGVLSTYGFDNQVLGWQFFTHVHTLSSLPSTATFFIPFYAPITGALTTLKIATATGGNTVRVAIYSTDANDMPVAPIGSVSTDFTSVANSVVSNGGNWFNLNTAVAATAPSVTRGEKYYVGITADVGTSVAGRESVCSYFLDDTYGDWYTAGGTDPGVSLHYLNSDSGAAAGDLPATVTVANLQNSVFAGFEACLVALEL